MKIVQLVYTLGTGGAEKFVVNLSNQLVEFGHEVFLVQIRNDNIGEYDIHFNRQFLSPKVNYVNLGLTKGFTFNKALHVMKSLIRIAPDLVNSHINLLPYYYPLSIFQSKTKFVHTLHSVADKETGYKWQRMFNRWIYRNKFIVPITISDECKDSFIKTYQINDVARINNGCPISKKSDAFDSVMQEMMGYKITPNTKVFIHVARFGKPKNQTLLVDSFNRLIKEGKDISLVVIGDGFDTEDASPLRNRSNERIHYLGSKKNVSDYLLNSDYFILSSLWEGLPISLIEAMSVRLIPVSTPAGGIMNVITDGINGFLSQDFSEESFVKTIEKALNTKIDKNQIFDTYDKKFSMIKCAKEYEKIYKMVVES